MAMMMKRMAGCPTGCRASRATSVCAPAQPQRRQRVVMFSTAQPEAAQKDGVLQFAEAVGLPTNEGIFGFRPFAETWCGRLAMMGFLTSIVEEFLTGQGTLAQMRLMDAGVPNYGLLVLLCVVFGGATVYGTVDTINKLRSKKMTSLDVARYKNFLALNNEDASKAAAMEMKRKGDFTSLGNDMAAIEASKAAGSPVDGFLATNDIAAADAAAKEMKAKAAETQPEPITTQGPSVSLQKRQDVEEMMLFSASSEMAYAKSVELSNGRWAMIGFLTAVLVEAATGNGIIMQIIGWLKLTGFLGEASGF